MALTVYVDGCGGEDPKYCVFIEKTAEIHIEKCPAEIANNKGLDKIPEYMALRYALKWLIEKGHLHEAITIYSDVQSLVDHVSLKSGINNDAIRDIMREVLPMIKKFDSLTVKWVSRKENLAGKMLGS